jgi:sirohydrochlorin cobaltochelatase
LHCSSAYLLVSHGSRDPRPQIALEHLAKLVTQRLQQRTPISAGQGIGQPSGRLLVGTAVLELAPLPLHQQIQQFAQQAISFGYEAVQIVPLFLLAGVHVMEDIPTEVEIARQQLQRQLHNIEVHVCTHLGSQDRLWQLLLNPIESMTTDPQVGKVVIAHGSRRTASNGVIEQIAAQIGALPAYWSVTPNLETQVTELIKRGHQQIAVLPYFLFEGGITDAIGQTVEQIKPQFPYAQIHLFPPIGATSALADRVVALIVEDTLQKLR